ncbi:MAG: AAA family ATPase [Flavobacteriaceae bacterium]|nr:AAA family ATPase [Flavobacteriaceae bacterium]
MTLIEHQKHILSEEVARLAAKTSQNRVAYNAGVSNATISKICRKEWKEISSEMWRRVQTNLRIDFDWNHAETTNFKILHGLCKTAQQNSLSIAISEDAGRGKSQTYTFYERSYNNVVYIECKNYWSKKQYIETLIAAVGLSTHGTTNVLIDRFIKHMKGQHRPLIIIDQFDKLKDSQTDLFMDFYNELSHNCGFVLSGVKALEKRILNGVNKNKIGYSEIYSRVGRKFIGLAPISIEDVTLICNANGVQDEEAIWYIFNNCEQDLRRVRRDVEKYHLQILKNKEIEIEEVKPRTKKEAVTA